MKNPYVLFRIQAVFWVILLVSVLSQSSITLFGKQKNLAIILGVVLLPIVEIITWPAAKLAPSRPWRNFFWDVVGLDGRFGCLICFLFGL